jgi:hypothetical protein
MNFDITAETRSSQRHQTMLGFILPVMSKVEWQLQTATAFSPQRK